MPPLLGLAPAAPRPDHAAGGASTAAGRPGQAPVGSPVHAARRAGLSGAAQVGSAERGAARNSAAGWRGAPLSETEYCRPLLPLLLEHCCRTPPPPRPTGSPRLATLNKTASAILGLLGARAMGGFGAKSAAKCSSACKSFSILLYSHNATNELREIERTGDLNRGPIDRRDMPQCTRLPGA